MIGFAFFGLALIISGQKLSLNNRDFVGSDLLLRTHSQLQPVPQGADGKVLTLSLYIDGLKTVEVNGAALLSYLDPMSAVVYTLIVFDEVLGRRMSCEGEARRS